MTERYYPTIFAEAGDVADIPDSTQPDGSVSYEEGFGPDYELILTGGPPAKAFPRNQYNEFCKDLTANLQAFQQWGVPLFIPSMTDGPGTYSYSAGVIVRYDPGSGVKLYQSLVDSNTAVPTNTTAWHEITVTDNSFYIYTSNFGSSVADKDIVSYSSVTNKFEQAIAGNAILENAVGIADVSNNRIQILGVNTMFSGLTPGSEYFLSSSSAGQITTIASSGVTQIIVGYAISATELLIRVQKEITNTAKYGVVTFGNTSGQTVPYGVTAIQFNNVQYDPYSWWDVGTFTWKPTIQGVYQITAAVYGNSSSTTPSMQGLELQKNGSALYWVNESQTGGPTSQEILPGGSSPPIPMNGTSDYLQLMWRNSLISTTTDIGVRGGSQGEQSYFSIQLVGL